MKTIVSNMKWPNLIEKPKKYALTKKKLIGLAPECVLVEQIWGILKNRVLLKYIQCKPLNVIISGPTIIDHINPMITLSDKLSQVLFSKCD